MIFTSFDSKTPLQKVGLASNSYKTEAEFICLIDRVLSLYFLYERPREPSA